MISWFSLLVLLERSRDQLKPPYVKGTFTTASRTRRGMELDSQPITRCSYGNDLFVPQPVQLPTKTMPTHESSFPLIYAAPLSTASTPRLPTSKTSLLPLQCMLTPTELDEKSDYTCEYLMRRILVHPILA